MAGEIQLAHVASGETLYALVRNLAGSVWNGSAFETYVTANLGTYAITMTEQGTASQYYAGNFPAVVGGLYSIAIFKQAGGSPAEGDITVGTESMEWILGADLMGYGIVTTGASTTSVPTSSCFPPGGVANQFQYRSIVFKNDTTTAALRGVGCRIIQTTNAAAPTFTVSTLPTTPASGDTFVIV